MSEAHRIEVSATRLTDGTKRLSEYVNTLRGSKTREDAYSRGNTAPLSARPHGFNFWTPLTDASSASWIYNYDAGIIQGFAASHIPSPWIGDYGRVQFMPQCGSVVLPPSTRGASFSHSNEIAYPNYYSVLFDNNIRTELAPTCHGCKVRLTFPDSAAHVVLESRDDAPAAINVDVMANTVCGYIDDPGGKAHVPRIYFWATFDKPISFYDAAANTQVVINFDIIPNEIINMSIGTSYISVEQAKQNVIHEIGIKTFDDIREEGAKEWDAYLGKIEIEGGTSDQMTTFYSCLYRVFLYPNSMGESDGTSEFYHSPFDDLVHEGSIYVNNGFWDTYKACWPLYILLEPTTTAEMLNGYTEIYKQCGAIPRWIAPWFVDCMVSTHSNVIFADAFVKGISFDHSTAYESAVRDAMTFRLDPAVGRAGNDRSIFLGYAPQDHQDYSASWTLENSICDAAIARMAKKMGRTEDEAYFTNRARAYVHLFDPGQGFFRGRNADGGFKSEFNPATWGYEYMEGDAWQYRFAPTHDTQGIANLLGGRDALARAIDATFAATASSKEDFGNYALEIHEIKEARDCKTGQYNPANQTDHCMIYQYNYAGAPSKAAFWAQDVMARLYGSGLLPGEGGLGYLGDEDNGSMSAWYVFSALGFFPAQGAQPEYLIGSPLFPKTVLNLENGNSFTILAQDHSSANIYVQSSALNGVTSTRNFFTHADVMLGGILSLSMGEKPSQWGTDSSDLPSSLTCGLTPVAPLVNHAGLATLTASTETPITGTKGNACDANSQTSWTATETTGWLQFKLLRPTAVQIYTLTSDTGPSTGDPQSWILEGSNDEVCWSLLDSRSGESFPWRSQTRNFSIGIPGAWLYYRLTMTAGNRAALLKVAEVELLAASDTALERGSYAN